MVSRGALPPEESTLPIPEEGVHFTFSSGAGAWSTDLTLFPDGTFSGKFHDRDMDITYLCQFQGAFSMLTPLDSRTWSLTLTDLLFSLGTACVICGGDTAFSPSPDHPAPFSPLHFF